MIDFKQTENGDIDLGSGDILMAEPTGQHMRDLLVAAQGHYKENPDIGVDSVSYLMDSEPDAYLRKVRKQCVRDGMTVKDIYMEHGELIIDAEYENG